MRKLFAVILSIIMLFSSLPVLSFGASEIVPISVTCKDSYPLSFKEIPQPSGCGFLYAICIVFTL